MTVQLDVKGMTCASCVRRVEKKLNSLDGVEATVNLATETATVTGDVPVAMKNGPVLSAVYSLIAFLDGALSGEAKAALLKLKTDSEELHFAGRELYLYFHAGMADSKLASALTPKKLGVNVTARNWNTVNALLKMGEEIDRRG